ncbi:MAG: hypothetical protein ACE5FG_13225 [Myxococcota bacterium]
MKGPRRCALCAAVLRVLCGGFLCLLSLQLGAPVIHIAHVTTLPDLGAHTPMACALCASLSVCASGLPTQDDPLLPSSGSSRSLGSSAPQPTIAAPELASARPRAPPHTSRSCRESI